MIAEYDSDGDESRNLSLTHKQNFAMKNKNNLPADGQ